MQLGTGLFGIVYDAGAYAVKYTKILEEDIIPQEIIEKLLIGGIQQPDKKYSVNKHYRELFFSQYFNNIHFMKITKQEFKKCNLKKEYKYNINSRKDKLFAQLERSPWCKIQHMTKVAGTLETYYNNISYEQKLAIGFRKNWEYAMRQVIYIINIMRDAGFCHNDLHLNNIGYKTTPNTHTGAFKNFKIAGNYCYIVIIDFECITYAGFTAIPDDAKYLRDDICFILPSLILTEKFDKKISTKRIPWYKIINDIQKTPLWSQLAERLNIKYNYYEGPREGVDKADFMKIYFLYRLYPEFTKYVLGYYLFIPCIIDVDYICEQLKKK